jgi:septal ring factor EnvC (AmiA/AmiB activator)
MRRIIKIRASISQRPFLFLLMMYFIIGSLFVLSQFPALRKDSELSSRELASEGNIIFELHQLVARLKRETGELTEQIAATKSRQKKIETFAEYLQEVEGELKSLDHLRSSIESRLSVLQAQEQHSTPQKPKTVQVRALFDQVNEVHRQISHLYYTLLPVQRLFQGPQPSTQELSKSCKDLKVRIEITDLIGREEGVSFSYAADAALAILADLCRPKPL